MKKKKYWHAVFNCWSICVSFSHSPYEWWSLWYVASAGRSHLSFGLKKYRFRVGMSVNQQAVWISSIHFASIFALFQRFSCLWRWHSPHLDFLTPYTTSPDSYFFISVICGHVFFTKIAEKNNEKCVIYFRVWTFDQRIQSRKWWVSFSSQLL